MQAFAGYFPIQSERMQSLQKPELYLFLYSFPPDFIMQMPDFNAPQQLAIF